MLFDITQSFMERSDHATTMLELATAFHDTSQALGFRHFACSSHVDPQQPPPGSIVLLNYPDSWPRAFAAREQHKIDPVFLHAEQQFLPFFWNAPAFRNHLTQEQQQLLAEAADIGLDRGWTIPIRPIGGTHNFKASCSVVPDSPSISTDSYLAVYVMATHMYPVADRINGLPQLGNEMNLLTRRERQCLEYAAQGKSDWEIGQILNISEHTVHRYFETAKQRFGVVTRVQAIVHALHEKQISFGDAIKATPAKDASRGPIAPSRRSQLP